MPVSATVTPISSSTPAKPSAKDMLSLIADVRERVEKAYGAKLENEVVVWNA